MPVCRKPCMSFFRLVYVIQIHHVPLAKATSMKFEFQVINIVQKNEYKCENNVM